MLMNYTLRFVLLMFIVYFISAQECSKSLSLLEMPVSLSQYHGSVGTFNNGNLFVQSKVSHFTYSSDNNENNNNLAIGLLILFNKIALVLLLLNLMSVFKGNNSKYKKKIYIWALFSTFVACNLLCWLYILLIILSGDVELNPGCKRKAAQALSACHWNLNSICAHNFTKLSLKGLCKCTQI